MSTRKFRKSIGFVTDRHFRRRVKWEFERITAEKKKELTLSSVNDSAVHHVEISTSVSTQDDFGMQFNDHHDQASSSIMELDGTLELQNGSHITEECSDLGSGEQSSTPRTRTTSSSIMELDGTLELQNGSHITEECSDLGSGEQSSTPRTRTTSSSIMELDGTLELQNGSHITEECSDLGSGEQSSTPRTRTTSSSIMELDGTLELQNGSHITEECSDLGSGEQSSTPRTRTIRRWRPKNLRKDFCSTPKIVKCVLKQSPILTPVSRKVIFSY
ncbi:uncharacterized protein LOC113375749 [Ctenocephalides felis]|uniref:uncharacterized protein LOC113375749 n=1 Tax=Ctenocephalides felis TaxID=7515 RepID=UPI000E6E3A14|nr:uncharacterized protein LOC113375749 [Ctenocephalides felis]